MSNPLFRRLNYAIGPVVAGMIIDAVDFVTFGPVGLAIGLPVGAAAGFWLARCLGLDQKISAFCALAAGIYCTIPYTELLPLGTLVGALVRFQESEPETSELSSETPDSADSIEAANDSADPADRVSRNPAETIT